MSNATGIQDTESTSDCLNSPSNLLLTSIQLHAAQKVIRHIQFVPPHFELLVHLGREEEALMQARLGKNIQALATVYTTLKEMGVPRPDLLDEMLAIVRRDKDEQILAASWLSNRLLEAGRYAEALEMIKLVRVDRSNHIKILTIFAEALYKLDRLDEARATCKEAEQIIRGYRESQETMRLLTDLGMALFQIGETEWSNRLLTEALESTQTIDESEILENHLITDMGFVASDFQKVGRASDANQILIRAEKNHLQPEKRPRTDRYG